MAILPRGANSGQNFIQCRDLAYDVSTTVVRNCKGLTIALEVKYFFTTSSSGANFFIHQLSESLEMRKILAHAISYPGSKPNLHPLTEISAMATLTPKSSITA